MPLFMSEQLIRFTRGNNPRARGIQYHAELHFTESVFRSIPLYSDRAGTESH
ncbi:MAG: hypothetical protein AB2531_05045 [Candidatus Thiodiazotropha sp.]